MNKNFNQHKNIISGINAKQRSVHFSYFTVTIHTYIVKAFIIMHIQVKLSKMYGRRVS